MDIYIYIYAYIHGVTPLTTAYLELFFVVYAVNKQSFYCPAFVMWFTHYHRSTVPLNSCFLQLDLELIDLTMVSESSLVFRCWPVLAPWPASPAAIDFQQANQPCLALKNMENSSDSLVFLRRATRENVKYRTVGMLQPLQSWFDMQPKC